MANDSFDGLVVIVTGAASGMGRRAAERFAASGAAVIACDIADLTQTHAKIESRHLDVTDEPAWEGLVAETLRNHGHLDALVNCAGVILMANVVDTKLGDFRHLMAVNVEGTFLGMKHAMRAMLPRGRGSIVNISSTAGIAGSPGASAYCASKGAVRLMTKSVALEAIAAGTRIRVNSLHPGLTDTPMLESIVQQLGGGEQIRAQLAAMVPAGRLGAIDEIVDAIMFLVSDRSGFMNGSEMVIDNGFTAQ